MPGGAYYTYYTHYTYYTYYTYQEARVRPVVSDFDCLLCGTRGISYLRPADNQTEVLTSLCLLDSLDSQ